MCLIKGKTTPSIQFTPENLCGEEGYGGGGSHLGNIFRSQPWRQPANAAILDLIASADACFL